MSTRRPYDLTAPEYSISEDRLDIVFKSLERNLELYERLYKDKIWIIESSIGRNEKISISQTRFFHMIGLDEKDFYDEKALSTFGSLFPDPLRIKELMKDRKDLFSVLEKMLESENNVKQAILDGTLKDIINPRKLEMKNYSFERIGIIERSSGIIFYDKTIANNFGFNTRLGTDLILLSNFIRKYKLEFVFSMYKKYRHNPNGKDAESLVIPHHGYKNSEFLIGQQASISESAKQYLAKDFEYTIRTQDSPEGQGPLSAPRLYIEFTDEDKAKMARAIIEGLPYLDNDHLKAIYGSLISNSKNKDIISNSKDKDNIR